MKIINCEMKKMKSLTKEQQEPSKNAKTSDICKEKFENKYLEDKKIVQLEIIAIIQGNIEVLCITYII